MSGVTSFIHEDGSVTLHRDDLPAIANPAAFDVHLTFEELQNLYLEVRRNQLSLNDTTGGLTA
jgi:hypothetical protein